MRTNERDRAEVSSLALTESLPSVEVMRVWYRRQVFPRHDHPYFTIGIVRGGTGTMWCRGSTLTLSAGDVVVIPPAEVHTGASSSSEPLVYTAMHVAPEVVARAAGSSERSRTSNIASGVIHDRALASALAAVDASLSEGDRSAAAVAAITAIDVLVCLRPGRATEEKRDAAPFVLTVKEMIDDAFADADHTSLDYLAGAAGVSPFHLVREFTRAVGLPPHQYLVQTRVRRARELLAGPHRISDIAASVGFVDQSHLTAHFRRHFGITPAAYKRGLQRPATA
jgi:AraC-like DNA-binding protein